jgi:hypothetical protein
MRALLAALALILACGENAHAQAFGGAAFGGESGTAAEADPTPFWEFNPSAGSGVEKLTADVWGMTTVVECDARTATVTNWACGTGGTFTESEGDVYVGLRAPFTETGMRANDYDRFYAHRAPTNSLAEVGSGVDVSMILIARVTARGAVQYVASKYDTVNSEGWGIRVTAGDAVQGVANATTFGSHALDAAGEWNIYEFQCDSGAVNGARLYVNGYLSGSAANCPSNLTTTTVAKHFSIGCRPNGTNNDCIDGQVAYVRVQTGTGLITGGTSVQDDVAQKHAQQVMGVWPTVTTGTAELLSTDLRNSRGVVDIDRDCDGIRQAFRVGAKWIRVGKRRETAFGGRCATGYLSEPQSTNLILHNYTMTNAAWTDAGAADSFTADSQHAPIVESSAGGVQAAPSADKYVAAADAVGLEHAARQSVTLTAAVYTQSIFFLYDGNTPTKQFGFLRNNTVANAIAYFDLKNCRVLSLGAGLKTLTEGPYLGARVDDYGVPSGNQRWCRASITYTGTAAAHDLDFGYAAADGDTTFTTSASENLGYMWGAQVEQIDEGYLPTSVILTTTATVQRNLDGLRAPGDNMVTSGQLVWQTLTHDTECGNDGTCNVAHYVCVPYVDANNYMLVKATTSTGQGILAGATASGGGVYFGLLNAGTDQMECCGQGSGFGQWYTGMGVNGNNQHDGQRHHSRFVFLSNDLRGYVDGDDSPGVADTTATIPDLTGGSILIGYESATGTNQPNGLIERCAIYSEEFEEIWP